MTKPAVLIDIDDTIADSQTTLLEHVNKSTRHTFLYEELTRVSREHDDDRYNRHVAQLLKRPEIIAGYAPFTDALSACERLHAAGYELHIASSRKEVLHDVTRHWLVRHGFAEYVTRVHPRASSQRGHDFKVAAAYHVGAVAAFDDTYEVVVALREAVPRVFLITRPWNRDETLPPNVVRTKSFSAAVDAFLE